MMTELEFGELCKAWGLPPAGEALMRSVRQADPARRVQSRRSNVVVRYTSKKMGCITCTSSSRTEKFTLISKNI